MAYSLCSGFGNELVCVDSPLHKDRQYSLDLRIYFSLSSVGEEGQECETGILRHLGSETVNWLDQFFKDLQIGAYQLGMVDRGSSYHVARLELSLPVT